MSKPRRRLQAEKEFGNRIQSARQEAKISKKELARKLNIEPTEFAKYEKGWAEMQVSTLVHYAALTGKPVEWFFRRGNDPPILDARQALAVLTCLAEEAERFRPRLDDVESQVTALILENQALRLGKEPFKPSTPAPTIPGFEYKPPASLSFEMWRRGINYTEVSARFDQATLLRILEESRENPDALNILYQSDEANERR